MMPSEHFVASVEANVAFWSERTSCLDSDGIREVDRERQNLYRAADFGLRLEDTWRDTTQLVLQSYTLIDERGYSRDWISLLERIVESCPQDDLLLKGRVLGQLGTLYRRTRSLEKALEIHHEEEEIGTRSSDRYRIACAHLHLANVYYRFREYDQGDKYAQTALVGFREIVPKSEKVAASLSTIGLIATNRGDLASAEEWMLEAVNLYRMLDSPLETGRALMNLGNILENGGRFEEAIDRYHEAQAQLRASGHKIEEMRLSMSLGTLLYHQGDLEQAEEVFRRADSRFIRQWAGSFQIAHIKMNLANVLLAQGKLVESEAYWRECITEWRQAEARLMLANSLGGLAETMAGKGEMNEAIALFDEALEIIAEYPDDAWAKKLEGLFSQERAEAKAIIKSGGHPKNSE